MNLSTFEQILIAGALMVVLMLVLWLVQLRTKDAGIVDAGWAGGLGLTAIFYAVTTPEAGWRQIILAVAAGTWSFRLAGYLLFNRVLRGEEDGRYQTLRRNWGARAPFYLLLFFEFQAGLVVLFSIPYLVVARNTIPALGWTDVVGVIILLGAVWGEVTADRQLARFRSNPSNRGKTCRVGLWNYSRHPNYFFEWLHWWGYVFLAIGSSWWWIALLGPGIMLLFLFKITGIPATEKQALASRGEDYRRYQRETSAFIPWPPKKEAR